MTQDRVIVKKWLLGAVGHEMDYWVRGHAIKYCENGIITKEDRDEIEAKIEAQYAIAEEA